MLTYDEIGNIICVEDPVTGITRYYYDQCRRVIGTEDALGFKTSYQYDAMDRLVKVTAPNGNERIYSYDKRGNLIHITDFNGALTRIEYNAKCVYGPTGTIDELIFHGGKRIKCSYDVLNRLSQIEDWLGEMTIERDVMGRVTRVVDFEGTEVSYSYALNG